MYSAEKAVSFANMCILSAKLADAGIKKARKDGRKQGSKEGTNEGIMEGMKEEEGTNEGTKEGRKEGRKERRNEGEQKNLTILRTMRTQKSLR